MNPYRLTYGQLLADLHTAYYDARRHKRNKLYQKRFEANLEHNLSSLCYELWTHSYRPRPSVCFIISEPKKREVFAAHFRDRIVHHLYFNYVHEMLERTFVYDSYSCIKKRGTHFGVNRLEHHIRQESRNYTQECYVLKVDIRGYFMHINRERLLEICTGRLRKMLNHRINGKCGEKWREKVDGDFVMYLTREIILLDPTKNCVIHGARSDWEGLAHDKSLFLTDGGCGLPIGNLTSQLFSNVYLGELDEYMKRELKCRHYGRYVDDFFVVGTCRRWLLSLLPKIKTFAKTRLCLSVHEGKTSLNRVRMGVEFIGAYIKPWRSYVRKDTLRRMETKLNALQHYSDCYVTAGDVVRTAVAQHLRSTLSSYCGLMSHRHGSALRHRLLTQTHDFSAYGSFDVGMRKFVPGNSMAAS